MKCPKCGHHWKHKPYDYERTERTVVYKMKGRAIPISITRWEWDGDWMAQFARVPGGVFEQAWGRTAKKAYEEVVKMLNA